MGTLYRDTDPQMEALQLSLLRQTPPWRKLEMRVELNTSARLLARSGLRQRYPQADAVEINRRLAALLYGEELAQKVIGE